MCSPEENGGEEGDDASNDHEPGMTSEERWKMGDGVLTTARA